MKLAIIVPAFNEEDYLSATLGSIKTAAAQLAHCVDIDLIVVDNNSSDKTPAIAREMGARLVHEPEQGVARARNTGVRHAKGDVLVFIDADVIVPPSLLSVICAEMDDPACVGGALDVHYRPQRSIMRLYLSAWRLLARLTGMAQGAAQFCRRCVFEQVGGYDQNVWIGEDVDFYRSINRFAETRNLTARFIRSPQVRSSSRRFDNWPVWKVLVWTNPLFIALFRRWKKAWSGWYSRPVR